MWRDDPVSQFNYESVDFTSNARIVDKSIDVAERAPGPLHRLLDGGPVSRDV